MLTSWERKGLEKGLKKGLREGNVDGQQKALITVLRGRFGKLPDDLKSEIEAIQSQRKLSALLVAAVRVKTLDEFAI